MGLGEGREFPLRLGIERPAAANDEGPLRVAQQQFGRREFRAVGARAARCPDTLLEDMRGEVESLGLHVLAEPERDRAAFGRVRQHLHGAGEGRDDLLRPGDTVEIARDRAEGVIGADGAVLPGLDLLQHRVGAARGEDIAGQAAAAAGG